MMYCEWVKLENRFAIREKLLENVKTLKTVYSETREGRPADTVAAYIAAVGYEAAAETIATLVIRHGWDGRIRQRVKEWAAGIPGAFDEEAAQHFGAYIDDVVHLAHFDQIAAEFMKTTPPEPDRKPGADPETSAQDPEERPETISAVDPVPAQGPEASAAVPAQDPEKRPEIIFNDDADRKCCSALFLENVRPEWADSIAARLIEFRREYSRIYEAEENGQKIDYSADVDLFDSWMSTDGIVKDYIQECCIARGDIFSSDREAAAFVRACAICNKRENAPEAAAVPAQDPEERPETISAADPVPASAPKTSAQGPRFTTRSMIIGEKRFRVRYFLEDGDALRISGELETGKAFEIILKPEDVTYAAARAAYDEKAAKREKYAAEPRETPEKYFTGMELKGPGYVIKMDGSINRATVTFKRKPAPEIREAVKAAGFYWSPNHKQWVRGLTHKAWRAAQELHMKLNSREAVSA